MGLFFCLSDKMQYYENSMVEQEARLKNLNFLRVRLYIYLVRSMILVEFIACDIFLSLLCLNLKIIFRFVLSTLFAGMDEQRKKKKPAKDFEQCFLFQFKYFLLSFFHFEFRTFNVNRYAKYGKNGFVFCFYFFVHSL